MNLRLMFFLALLLPSLPAGADPVADLYAADVPVTDQSSEQRAAALTDALGQVLIKVTGSETVLQTETGSALLRNPSRYLQQYRYRAIDPPRDNPDAPRLALHAEFDGRALEQQLRSAGLPLWGRERPLTLAWVAISDGSERELLAADSEVPEVAALNRAADRRGLPVQLPQMDEQDATRVSFMDVWGVFEEPLLDAAERYSPDAVLAGSVFRAGDELWAGRWTLLRDGMRLRWEVQGHSPAAVIVAAVDSLAERYAQEFAVGGELVSSADVMMEIVDVGSLEDYATVQSYLGGLSVVENVQLVAVEDRQLRVALRLNGTTRSLEQAIALGRTLEKAPVQREVIVPLGEMLSVDNTATEPVLRYRYRR